MTVVREQFVPGRSAVRSTFCRRREAPCAREWTAGSATDATTGVKDEPEYYLSPLRERGIICWLGEHDEGNCKVVQ